MHTNLDLDLQLMTRPDSGNAVALVAERLRLRLLDGRTGLTHDYRLRRDERHTATTLAPLNSPGWATDTENVWGRVEWTERHGPAPLLFEVRTEVPAVMDDDAMRDFAWAMAGFVSRELRVPVTYVVFDGTAPISMPEDAGRQVRLCFPTRSLALPDGSDSVLDRSSTRSGFAGRLAMTGNPQLGKAFAGRLMRESSRLWDLESAGYQRGKTALSRVTKRPFVFDFVDDEPPVVLETDAKTHPLVARLRREAPRDMSLPELRDFEFAMGIATHVEDALKAVSDQEGTHDTLGEQQTRLTAHALDHEFELDRARERRAKAREALREANQRANSLFEMLRRRMDAASRVRDRVAAEAAKANDHVQELKAAVSSLRDEAERMRQEKVVAAHTLTRVRDDLKTSVRRLHGTDPRLLEHLLGIITGAERTYLQSAMAKVVPVVENPAESNTDQGKSGPPVKPSRGSGPGR
jgi:hypothetical protein